MRRSICCWLAGGLLLGAAARAESSPVVWVSPSTGAVWNAGESVTLEWRRSDAWPRELHVEEWEAFLSLDGGRSFPVRLTPHLEADLRVVRVPVPNLPTERARLLLRFGDERREVEWLVPGEFTIRAGRRAALITDDSAVAALEEGRGEAARPGDPGVVFWAEGRRDGGDWRAAAGVPTSDWRPSVGHDRGGTESAASAESPTAVESRRSSRILSVAAPPGLRAPSRRVGRVVPVLRLVERLNE